LERLQKILAHAGVASRRKAEQMILDGRVQVNGEIVLELGKKVDPERDHITVDGERVRLENYVYYLFHKPLGVITSVSDPQGRKVVMDYFKKIPQRIYPVGRLDYNTSGLLLLTNDGELSHQLMHPSFHVQKGYLATVEGVPDELKLERLRKGIMLNDGLTSPAQVEKVSVTESRQRSRIRLTIYEGRKRQVRRMFKAIGHPVIELHRETYAFLTLAGLNIGEYRKLTQAEIEQLKGLTSHNFHK
jgi:23S rRNA pseudouridine2605 synthase